MKRISLLLLSVFSKYLPAVFFCPRCQAGGVALSVTLAMLIQRDPKHLKKSGEYNINAIISDVFDYASKLLSLDAEVC